MNIYWREITYFDSNGAGCAIPAGLKPGSMPTDGAAAGVPLRCFCYTSMPEFYKTYPFQYACLFEGWREKLSGFPDSGVP
jgi:hypothetical protein